MRQATNPLTREKLLVREVINEVVGTDQYDILCAAVKLPQPASQAEIINRSGVTRPTASNHLAVLRDRGFVKRHESGIEATAGGKVLLEQFEECPDTLTQDRLAHLTGSRYPINTLLAIDETETRKCELSSVVSDDPSRSTIGRVTDSYLDNGWISGEPGPLQLTPKGKRALIGYSKLTAAVEQLIKKANWLQRLPPQDATFPVHELEDASVVASDSSNPAVALWNALKLCDLRTSRFRCLVSIHNPVLFHTYKAMLDFGIESESIIDWSTYREIQHNQGTDFATDESKYPCYQPHYLDYSHTLGIGIYDDRKVAVGAYNERGEGQHIAMIVTSNEALIEWAIDLYESYREQASPTSEDPPVDRSQSPALDD